MPTYKLTYFDGKGRAEVIRMAFAAGVVKYEDVRVRIQDWPTVKPTMPLGVMPVLEVDGKIVSQTLAILRYVGRECGLYGRTSWEGAEIDCLLDTLNDIWGSHGRLLSEQDPDKKEHSMAPIGVLSKHSTNHPMSRLRVSVNIPTNRPPNQPAGRPLNKTTDPPTHRPPDPSDPPTPRPTGRPPNQPIDPPNHRPTDPPIHRSTDPPTHQPTDPPTHRPTTGKQALIAHKEEVVTRTFGIMEKAFADNSGGKGFLVGSTLTIADLALYAFSEYPVNFFGVKLDKFPRVAAHRDMVERVPRIADYLKTRPDDSLISQFLIPQFQGCL
ncbi:hypothetical protein ScPMuIL_005062 [Solemya velum]